MVTRYAGVGSGGGVLALMLMMLIVMMVVMVVMVIVRMVVTRCTRVGSGGSVLTAYSSLAASQILPSPTFHPTCHPVAEQDTIITRTREGAEMNIISVQNLSRRES